MKRITAACILAFAAFAAFSAEAATSTFSYTGNEQTFVVPAGVTSVHINGQGASGWSGSNPGGLGGTASGDLTVSPGETLYIYVGGQGTVAIGDMVPAGGGYNGGGDGQNNSTSASVGGGGGASDVRQGGNIIGNRVLVAAGGGGSTNNETSFGGDGGGLDGADGGFCSVAVCIQATGASQVAGGSAGGTLGQGGDADATMTPWNGGGGGGYYGGGVSIAHSGGGGGSSYIDGVGNGSTTAGSRSGDGLVELTYGVSVESQSIPTLTEWMLILLAALMVTSGLVFMRRIKS